MSVAVLTFEDISERRQADEALRRSEQSLREAQRIANIGNWELGPYFEQALPV